ncbi:transposase [Burkholderia sp. MSMB1552]|nr:transposase [Burkholderia sp. MSMB1552]KWZ55390.1 transposase [Burkholderia sp. MSMB1588]
MFAAARSDLSFRPPSSPVIPVSSAQLASSRIARRSTARRFARAG